MYVKSLNRRQRDLYFKVNCKIHRLAYTCVPLSNALDPTEELSRHIRQLFGTLVGMTRGCDALGDSWVVRKLLQGGMNAPLVAFRLRPKLAQLTPEVIGINLCFVTFDFHRVQLLLHMCPKRVQQLDFHLSRLQAILAATSAGALFV